MDNQRRLLAREEVEQILGLTSEKVEWLISTGQLPEILICGARRFDSADVFRLVESYKRVQTRRSAK